MKRILVKENPYGGINSPTKSLREGNGLATDLNKRINSSRRPLREEERSMIDLQALEKVQEQFDSLIKEMLTAKISLAGIGVGSDDVYYEKYGGETNEID
jgi:hypothetical protein